MSDFINQIDWGNAALVAANTLSVLRPFAEAFVKKALEKTAEKSVEQVFELLNDEAGKGNVREWAKDPEANAEAFQAQLERLIQANAKFAQDLQAALKTAVGELKQAGYQVNVQTGDISGNTGSVIVVSSGPVNQTIAKSEKGPAAAGPGARAIQANTYNEKLEMHQHTHPPAPDPQVEKDAQARTAYLAMLLSVCQALPLAQLGGRHAADVLQLEDVYIDLETTSLVVEVNAEEELKKRGIRPTELKPGEQVSFAIGGREGRQLRAIEAAAQHDRLALLGDPGSGKTAFVRHVLANMVFAQMGKPHRLPADYPAKLTPVLVLLRDVAARVGELDLGTCDATTRRMRLAHVIIDQALHDVKQVLSVADFAPQLDDALRRGQVVLVLDGLDEMSPKRRALVREAVMAYQTVYRPERLIVTCRVKSYTERAQLTGFGVHSLALLNEGQIATFAQNWYLRQFGKVEYGQKQLEDWANDLQAAAQTFPAAIAGNPMLLTTMAGVHQSERKLPKDRVRLYSKAVEILLYRWQVHKGTVGTSARPEILEDILREDKLNDLLRFMAEIAFQAHTKGAGIEATENEDDDTAADLTYDEALSILRGKGMLGNASRAEAFLEYVDRHAGLLIGRGGGDGDDDTPDTYSFPHRSFQEYLAGYHLSLVHYPKRAQSVFDLLKQEDYWFEAVKLCAEELFFNSRDGVTELADLADRLHRLQHRANGAEQARLHVWVGMMAARLQEDEPRLVQSEVVDGNRLLHDLRDELIEILRTNTLPATERAEAGRTLAQLGDNRPGVGVDPATGLPDIRWCFVPGGPFVMGANDISDDEKPQHPNEILKNGYWLAQYPVTVQQWKAFCDLSGHKPKDENSRRDPDNHPVRYVTWYEALKFAEWLDGQYRAKSWLPTGYHITLPSEAEWEKAARGGLQLPSTLIEPITGQALKNGLPEVELDRKNDHPARRYPWGDQITPEHANYDDTRIGSTSAVGAFAGKGTSPYGCLDLSGNVWEWTRSLWGKDWNKPEFGYPYEQNYPAREALDAPDDMYRVLRGGSFLSDTTLARCAFRLRYGPDGRDVDGGFRVVASR